MNDQKNWKTPYSLTALACLIIGCSGFLTGLGNAETLALSEKGFYLILLAFGLFSAVSVQKNVRDSERGIPVPPAYSLVSYSALVLSLGMLGVGLINASMQSSEKGFYAMSFILALFSAITFQKQLRDIAEKEVSADDKEVDLEQIRAHSPP